MATHSSGPDAPLLARLLEGSTLALEPLADAPPPDDDEGTLAPGWYDSSWALRHGLEVREGEDAGIAPGEWQALFGRP